MTIKHLKAPGSGRLVAINLNDSNHALLEEISIDEMREVIAEFEQKRIEEYWIETMLKQPPDSNFLNAFQHVNRGQSIGPLYYNSNYLQKVLNTKSRGTQLISIAHSLPLEDQRNLVLSTIPRTRRELQVVLSHPDPVIAPDFYAMLEEAGDAEAFISRLVNLLLTNDSPLLHPFRYFELLTLLWSRGWLLFPQLLADWHTRIKWPTLSNPTYGGVRSELIRAVFPTQMKRASDPAYGLTCTFFATTDVRSFKDLSPELIRNYEDICLGRIEQRIPAEVNQKKLVNMRARPRSVALWLMQNFNNENPEHAVTLKRSKPPKVADEDRRVDGNFRWLASKRPELLLWSELFREFIKSRTTARIGSFINRLNIFGDFLCTLTAPPINPWSVVRQTHIYDATLKNTNTYYEYLKDHQNSAKSRNDNISTIRQFFDWLQDYLVATENDVADKFPNPVLSNDSIGRTESRTRTARDSLPPYIINELKAILIDNDFEFTKKQPRANVQVRDYQTGLNTRVFDPGIAVCLYTLLDTPIRSHQVRWLDSGHLDDKIYDPTTNRLIPNPSKHAIPGRREGVLRLEHDGLRDDSWLSLWVNTNKTASYDSSNVSYAIPYVSTELAELLIMYSKWQKRYLPELTAPLSYQIYQDDVRERPRHGNYKGPQIAPLFRDPYSSDLNTPIEYPRISRFYIRVLAEAQKRIEKKYGHKVKLTTKDENGKQKWLVDLHSLRVSGITNLIEAGVPLEVVQQFVAGHTTLVMTLHYLRYNPVKLRKFLEEAYEKMINDVDFVGSEIFTQSIDQLAPFLLGQEGAGIGAGFQALQDNNGIVTITSEGICPGTSCSSGGAPLPGAPSQYGPVPGGKRCGLCRFWLTGPAHLLGQVAAVNNLAYTIRKKGMELSSLNDQRIDAEDTGDQRTARKLRDKADILNRELEIDINEWVARYKYAEKSVALMDSYISAKQNIIATDSNLQPPILTSSSAGELKITLEQAHEFALLDQITQLSPFATGFKNNEAALEKNNILSGMMSANGIKPFLLNLNAAQAHEAGNLLSSMLLQQVQSQDLDDVLTGAKPLADYPSLSNTIQALEKSATSEALARPDGVSKLAKLFGIDQASFQNDQDEDLFG